MGAALNAFSLNEPDALSSAIEKTGQAIDTTHLSTNRLVRVLHFLKSYVLMTALAGRSRTGLGGTFA